MKRNVSIADLPSLYYKTPQPLKNVLKVRNLPKIQTPPDGGLVWFPSGNLTQDPLLKRQLTWLRGFSPLADDDSFGPSGKLNRTTVPTDIFYFSQNTSYIAGILLLQEFQTRINTPLFGQNTPLFQEITSISTKYPLLIPGRIPHTSGPTVTFTTVPTVGQIH